VPNAKLLPAKRDIMNENLSNSLFILERIRFNLSNHHRQYILNQWTLSVMVELPIKKLYNAIEIILIVHSLNAFVKSAPIRCTISFWQVG